MFFKIFCFFSSCILEVLYCFIRIAANLGHKQSIRFSQNRHVTEATLKQVAKKRKQHSRAWIFLCSSAGEFEQAQPISDLFKDQGDFVFTFLFSPSGEEFLAAGKRDANIHLACIDSLRLWSKWFKAIQPESTFIVRHEIWPSFLYTAKKHGSIFLVNSSLTTTDLRFPKNYIKKWMFNLFDKITTVSIHDKQLIQSLGITTKVLATGDSKYDRVMSRKQERSSLRKKLSDLYSDLLTSEIKFIIGSSWPEDLNISLAALENFPSIQLIVVPHTPNEATLLTMEEMIQKSGKKSVRLSQLRTKISPQSILLVDQLGILAEFYSLGHFALVGGGFGRQVHNVLEPASYGLPICHGPQYQKSREAQALANNSLSQVIQEPKDLTLWLQQQLQQGNSGGKTMDYMKKNLGASQKIVQECSSTTTT